MFSCHLLAAVRARETESSSIADPDWTRNVSMAASGRLALLLRMEGAPQWKAVGTRCLLLAAREVVDDLLDQSPGTCMLPESSSGPA